jgi:hypothetical protein
MIYRVASRHRVRRSNPDKSEFEAGKNGRKHLIKSEPPKRKSAAKVVLELESTEEIGTETV